MINVTKSFLPPYAEYEAHLRDIWASVHLTNAGPKVVELERQLRDRGVRIHLSTRITELTELTDLAQPAGPAGQQVWPDHVILAIDGRPVTASDELVVAIRARTPGDAVSLRVRAADGAERDVRVVLNESAQG